jgi:hypothetical protein
MPEQIAVLRPKPVVLSLSVQAELATSARQRSWFEILVRHFFTRFFHNELITSDDGDARRIMIVAYAFALPGLLVALFLYPAYHGFPPNPLVRPFWAQTCDHYFYVMYSFIVMGAATVYEWDLLFPDLLDVFVLSVLPIDKRHLFFARVLALAIFLGLVLLGTSGLGIIFLSIFTEAPPILLHYLAHTTAVLASGTFAAATFLALQGILLNTVGENIFRRITPLLQGASVLILLTILLLTPTITHSLQPLLNSSSPAIGYFPPFWFLGIYESILAGPSALPIFHQLARNGCIALLIALAVAFLTYPLAYRRRVRQLIEGGTAVRSTRHSATLLHRILHATILRVPAQRAIFHFISQTILRAQKQRVMLAMYGGLAIALAISSMLIFRVEGGHAHPALTPDGIRAATPILIFWTIAGLSSIFSSSIDRRGAWIFRIIHGRPGLSHLAGARIWIISIAILIGLAAAALLHTLSPDTLRTPTRTTMQLIAAIGIPFLLANLFLYPTRTIPFTHTRQSSITDMPLVVVRYFILFPIFISMLLSEEKWMEIRPINLTKEMIILTVILLLIRARYMRNVHQSPLDTGLEDPDAFPQSLGLRD